MIIALTDVVGKSVIFAEFLTHDSSRQVLKLKANDCRNENADPNFANCFDTVGESITGNVGFVFCLHGWTARAGSFHR